MKLTCCVCLQSQRMPLCVCFQRKGACRTVNHRSPPPVGTAPPVQPPPKAQQGHARPRAHDSHYSGPPQSMLISWGPTVRSSTRNNGRPQSILISWRPMDRSSTRGSYVSNSGFCCCTAVLHLKSKCIHSQHLQIPPLPVEFELC